ncbi:MAG TPA: stage III sporulation protein AC [Clostridia bacterium]
MQAGVEIIFRIAAIGILTAVVTQILKKADKDEIATLVTLAGLIVVLLMVINMISQLFDTVKQLFNLYRALKIAWIS